MSSNLNNAIQNSSSSGSTSISGGGNENGSQFAIATPVYTNDNFTISVGAERCGGWSSDNGSRYSVGVGFSWKID